MEWFFPTTNFKYIDEKVSERLTLKDALKKMLDSCDPSILQQLRGPIQIDESLILFQQSQTNVRIDTFLDYYMMNISSTN